MIINKFLHAWHFVPSQLQMEFWTFIVNTSHITEKECFFSRLLVEGFAN